MSGSPPPEPSKDPAQLAGRRRKRSDTPPTTTATSTAVTVPALVEHTAQRYGEQQTTSSRSYEGPTMQIAPQPVPYLPPLTYGAGPGAPITHYSTPDLSSNPQQISPRNTRKTKAHVASACINCKKKHLRCDSSRPCRRCVQSGKEDTCRDVEHKKRGRPPLKPEDPTIIGRRTGGHANLGPLPEGFPARAHQGSDPRGYIASNYPPILPNNGPPPMYGHQRNTSTSSLYRGFPSPYAPPSVAQSPLNVTATGGFSYATRPQSTSSTMSMQPTSPYVPHPSYLPQGTSRQAQSYAGYPFHPVDLPPTTQPFYSNPIFPRDQVPSMQIDSQYTNTLQLPPIRHSQHGSAEPTASQQRHSPSQYSVQQQGHQRDSGERDPKRPKMDIQGILGPKHD